MRGGIKTVLIPLENLKDLQDIPANVKTDLEIIPVRWIDDVLRIALERMPVALDEETVVSMPAAAPKAVATKAAAKKTRAIKH